jgi:hypothetical protein
MNMKSTSTSTSSSIPSSLLSSLSTSTTYQVAKQLLLSGKWALYLSPEQLPLLSLALETEDKWTAFCHDPTTILDALQTAIEESVLQTWGSLETVLTVTAFRIRSMIFEQWLPLVCNDDAKPYCTASVDWNRFTSTSTSSSTAITHPSSSVNDLPPEKIASRLSNYIPIDDVYHTLEDELEAKESYQTHGIPEKENEANRLNDNMDSEMVMRSGGDVSHVAMNNKQQQQQQQQQLSTNSFKYLLEAVAAIHEPKVVAKMKAILTDFRPRKSKWSSEDKVGQEDLYEACDNVLDALKKFEVRCYFTYIICF